MLGAATQLGVFIAVIGAMTMGFSIQEAAGIGIIGRADGPTAIYLCAKLAKDILPAVLSCRIQLHVPCSSHTASCDQAPYNEEDRAIKAGAASPRFTK